MDSEYRLEIDDSVAHTGIRSLKIIGVNATDASWHTRVLCDSIPIENGKVFTIAFWAKVDAEEGQSREVDINAQLQDEPLPGFHNETIVIDGVLWREYTDTFVVTSDEAESMRAGLSVSLLDVDFWIDDFRIFEGQPGDETMPAETAVRPGRLPASWGSIRSQY